jgi:BASS family bile acid:Na+ symporter
MSLAPVIQTVIQISMLLLVFALGARSAPGDAGYLFRQPSLLWRSLLAMNVLIPLLVAIGLLVSFDLRPAVSIALIALAVSPVPPFLPGKQLKLVSHNAYVYGLLVVASLAAIAVVPFTMALTAQWLGREAHVTPLQVLRIVGLTVIIPLGMGMMARHFYPAGAARAGPIVNRIASALLLTAFVGVVIWMWPDLCSLMGDGTLLAAVMFTVAGLFIGHLLGGPDEDNRTVLALATASRHPAVALVIANAAVPDEELVPAAVLLVLLVNVLAVVPYTAWRKRLHWIGGRRA